MFEPHKYAPQPHATQAPFSARQVLPYISFDPLGDVATIAAVEDGDTCQASVTLLDAFLDGKKKTKGKDPNDLAREGVDFPAITDFDPGLPIERTDIVPTDFSLGGEHRESSYEDYVEPDPISAEAYFDLTDEEKREVARDARGLPYGHWSWSKEAWNRYGRENPRTPNAGPPRESVNAEPPPDPIILHGFNPADWEGKKAPPRLWVVPDYMPDRTVTLLYADGGTRQKLSEIATCRRPGSLEGMDRAYARTWPHAGLVHRR